MEKPILTYDAWDNFSQKFIDRKLVNINGDGEVFLTSYHNEDGTIVMPIHQEKYDITILNIKILEKEKCSNCTLCDCCSDCEQQCALDI
jgi:hypothetical protein